MNFLCRWGFHIGWPMCDHRVEQLISAFQAEMPAFNYPPEVADVADETLAHYQNDLDRRYPDWSFEDRRRLAIQLAEANLSDRADFRRDIAFYTQGRQNNK